MAEERNAVSPAANETAEIKHEIERTRVEMIETIGEIQERLRPDHLLQQAKDGFKDAAAGKARSIMSSAGEKAATMAYQARGAGDSLLGFVQAHPIRVALTVGAVAWWMLRSHGRSDEDGYGAADSSWEDEDAMSFGEPTLRHRVGEYAATAREAVGEYASTARDTVGEYASSARETAGVYAESARERARLASDAARRAASTATASVDDWVHENPLAVGMIALAVGAAIALAVPATELENRTMGEARDRALERATKAANEIKDNVTRKVETAAENFVQQNVLDPLTGVPAEPMGRA